MILHEAVCFLAGWNAACLVSYFMVRNLVERPTTRTGKVYFDPHQTLPETPIKALLDRCRP